MQRLLLSSVDDFVFDFPVLLPLAGGCLAAAPQGDGNGTQQHEWVPFYCVQGHVAATAAVISFGKCCLACHPVTLSMSSQFSMACYGPWSYLSCGRVLPVAWGISPGCLSVMLAPGTATTTIGGVKAAAMFHVPCVFITNM